MIIVSLAKYGQQYHLVKKEFEMSKGKRYKEVEDARALEKIRIKWRQLRTLAFIIFFGKYLFLGRNFKEACGIMLHNR